MAGLKQARAYANNEVAYIAWELDGPIPGCLGFEVTRIYLNEDGSVALRDGVPDRVRCASWVAFKGQRNPHWLPQNTGIWPVQKLSWRDLTLRKKRDALRRRPDEVRVRYEVRPVGDLKGWNAAGPRSHSGQSQSNEARRPGSARERCQWTLVKVEVPAYEGVPRPLGYLGPAVETPGILISRKRGAFQSTFTNGMLAAQWLRNVLMEDGAIEPNELMDKLANPADPHRKYLAGDVIPLLHELFDRDGEFYLALYELDDRELKELLLARVRCTHPRQHRRGRGWNLG